MRDAHVISRINMLVHIITVVCRRTGGCDQLGSELLDWIGGQRDEAGYHPFGHSLVQCVQLRVGIAQLPAQVDVLMGDIRVQELA